MAGHRAGSGRFQLHKCAPPEAFEAERVVRLQVLLEQVVHAGLLALPQEPQSSRVSKRRVTKAHVAALKVTEQRISLTQDRSNRCAVRAPANATDAVARPIRCASEEGHRAAVSAHGT